MLKSAMSTIPQAEVETRPPTRFAAASSDSGSFLYRPSRCLLRTMAHRTQIIATAKFANHATQRNFFALHVKHAHAQSLNAIGALRARVGRVERGGGERARGWSER